MKYSIITPVKNEEKSLIKTFKSVNAQTIKPNLWIIVDDGSTDKTPKIINRLVNRKKWIKSLRLKNKGYSRGKHYAEVCRMGFKKIFQINRKIDFIGVIDADIKIDSNYFEGLIEKFKKNKKLGIASGSLCYINRGKMIPLKLSSGHAHGAARLFRKECFEDIGGYLAQPAPDKISNIKARIKGWKVKNFPQHKAFQLREEKNRRYSWIRHKKFGEFSYYLNYNPLLVLFRGIKIMMVYSIKSSLAYLYGYIKSLIIEKKKIEDKKIREYNRNLKKQKIFKKFLDILKN